MQINFLYKKRRTDAMLGVWKCNKEENSPLAKKKLKDTESKFHFRKTNIIFQIVSILAFIKNLYNKKLFFF